MWLRLEPTHACVSAALTRATVGTPGWIRQPSYWLTTRSTNLDLGSLPPAISNISCNRFWPPWASAAFFPVVVGAGTTTNVPPSTADTLVLAVV